MASLCKMWCSWISGRGAWKLNRWDFALSNFTIICVNEVVMFVLLVAVTSVVTVILVVDTMVR